MRIVGVLYTYSCGCTESLMQLLFRGSCNYNREFLTFKRNHDDNIGKNATYMLKVDLCSFKLHHNYSNSFTLSNAANFLELNS